MDRVSKVGLALALPGRLLAAGLPRVPPGLRLDWSALDRAARLVASIGGAPVRRARGEMLDDEVTAGENGKHEGGRGARAASAGIAFLGSAQGLSPGAAIAPAGRVGVRSAVERQGDGTSREAPHLEARSGVTRSRGVALAAVQIAARATTQAQAATQDSLAVDAGAFAALGAPFGLNLAMALGTDQGARTPQAAALLPVWMAGGTAGGRARTAVAARGGDFPGWAVPEWRQAVAGSVYEPGTMDRDDGSRWLVPAQGSPAAPRTASVAAEAGRSFSAPAEQAREQLSAHLPVSGASDAWTGPAGAPGSVARIGSEAGFEGFGPAEEARRRVLDEMARLVSRPPAGITGFDAGQTPAWLGGWTGGM